MMPNMKRKVKTLLIGVGYHARRIYLPYLKDGETCELVACLDLAQHEERVKESINLKFGSSVSCYFTYETTISDTLQPFEARQLNNIIKEHKIEAVIISTEPLAHFKYVYWAVKKGLHILLDKPVTTEIGGFYQYTNCKEII